MDDVVLVGYFISLFILFIFGSHGFIMMYYHNKYRNVKHKSKAVNDFSSRVTIQLPLYNELYVVERLIHAVCEIESGAGFRGGYCGDHLRSGIRTFLSHHPAGR